MNGTSTIIVLALLMLTADLGCDSPPPMATTKGVPRARTVSNNQPIETTFDDVKFDMEKTDPFKRSLLTPKIEDLFGKRIRIRGYMYPTLKRKGLTAFVLVRDNLECCFGQGAALFDCMRVQMHPDKTATYTAVRPITVEGVFKFDEFTDFDGTTRAIYMLDQASVE